MRTNWIVLIAFIAGTAGGCGGDDDTVPVPSGDETGSVTDTASASQETGDAWADTQTTPGTPTDAGETGSTDTADGWTDSAGDTGTGLLPDTGTENGEDTTPDTGTGTEADTAPDTGTGNDVDTAPDTDSGDTAGGTDTGASPQDECNTTAECQQRYGAAATDCVDSRSDQSWCDCGGVRCSDLSTDPDTATSGDTATGGTGDWDVPQPPDSCSNIAYPIPEDIQIHTILNKHVSRSEFDQYSHWYVESGNIQRMQLHDGDQNTTSSILRPRIEAYAPTWTRGDGSTWHEFSANYYLDSWDEPQLYAVFQIKTNDASNFIIQGLIEKDGSLQIARRSKGRVRIADNVYQVPFHLRVRDNGYHVEVWLNCERVLSEDHPQPDLESSSTRYGFRWGLYRQQTEEDRQIGTTTLYVTGPRFD